MILDSSRTQTPFDIIRTAHAELIVTDLAASEHFYVDLLGLAVTARADDALYLRGYEDRLHHSLVLRLGSEPLLDHLAFRVGSPDDLPLLDEHFRALGCEPRLVEGVELGQGPALRVQDPLGFPLEFFYEMEHVDDCLLQRYDLYRGARLTRADHVNLFVPDVTAAHALYRELGFRCSEYIASDVDDALLAIWLFRKPSVHDVALTNGAGPRMHHFAFNAIDAAAVIWACEILGAAGYPIERGPGRHGVSNAFYVYLRDPDGHRIELYACDYYTGDPDLVPIRWSAADPRRRSFWGGAIPDSWYDEGTPVRGRDALAVPLRESSLDERLVAAE